MDLDSVCEDLYSLCETFLHRQLLSAYCLAFESSNSQEGCTELKAWLVNAVDRWATLDVLLGF